jgi:putative transposase
MPTPPPPRPPPQNGRQRPTSLPSMGKEIDYSITDHLDRGIDADGVVDVLDHLALQTGAPVYGRFDNGPEFVAHAVHDWCRFNGTGSLFIDPGSPWQNAWIESFNGRLSDELLNSWRFDSLLEARVIIEDWRADYNANRPHTAHCTLTPNRIRSTVDYGPPTPSRIATGPPNGSPSVRQITSRYLSQDERIEIADLRRQSRLSLRG